MSQVSSHGQKLIEDLKKTAMHVVKAIFGELSFDICLLDKLMIVPITMEAKLMEAFEAGAHKALLWTKSHYPNINVVNIAKGVAEGISDADLKEWNTSFVDPAKALVEWANFLRR